MIFYIRRNTNPVKKSACDGQYRLPKVASMDVIISIVYMCTLCIMSLHNEVKMRLG